MRRSLHRSRVRRSARTRARAAAAAVAAVAGCPLVTYAIAPGWFARFAVRARSELGLAYQRFFWRRGPRPLLAHCPPHYPPSPRGTCKIPTEAGDGVVLAYAIVPVWFTRFAVRARSKLGLTCERKTRRGQSLRTRRHPAVARHTTLHVVGRRRG